MKRRGDVPRSRRGHDPSSSETGNNPNWAIESIDKRERVYQAFGAFLQDFVRDLNNSSEEGWSLLVEGLRDERAIRELGYQGGLITVSDIGRGGRRHEVDVKKVIILTDLDREGTVLASRFMKSLGHKGVQASLNERRRLKVASRGVFLHVENLSRFADPGQGRWDTPASGPPPVQTRTSREGLRRNHRHPQGV